MLGSLSLLAAAASGSALTAMDDRQFCRAMDGYAGNLVGSRVGQAVVAASAADCRARTVTLTYRVNLGAQQGPAFIKGFVRRSHASICRGSSPSAQAFVARGWTYVYSFAFRGATVRGVRLDCRIKYDT